MSVIKKDWDDKLVLSKVDGLLKNYDDGELFVEEVFSENILFDENKIKNAGMEIFDISTDEPNLEDVFIDVTKG